MKVGLCLPYMKSECKREQLLQWFRRLDQGPFSTISCGERVIGGAFDMRILVAAAAACTERIRIMPTLYVMPMHSAARVAKEIATLDVLTDGRLSVTLGVGGREEDFRIIGASFDNRHERMDEQVAQMRQIWNDEPIAASSEHIGPPPLQQGGPELLIGAMGEKGMRHGAQWASGVYVFSMNGEKEEIRGMLTNADQAWSEAGKKKPYKIGGFWYTLARDGESKLQQYVFDYMRIAGEDFARDLAKGMNRYTPDAVREGIDNLLEAGCDEIFLSPATAEYAEIDGVEELLAQYANR